MACPGEGILTDLAKRLVDKTIKEVTYFRHFETHDHEFDEDNQLLRRRLEKVRKDIDDANINAQEVDGEVQDWIKKADKLIQMNAEVRQTRFDSCSFLRKYRQGKILAQRAQVIKSHIQNYKNFEGVARPSKLPGMKYHASKDFIDFESRKTKFKELLDALEDGNHYTIGLQGMAGTGKTTLATQVGKQVEESKAFEKVIFVVVSSSPNVNKIRGDIARQLGLDLDQRIEADHSKHLWSRISNNEKKLLIIFDDVWEKLDLTELGIPSGPDHKNCYVLITTRHSKVYQQMICQKVVHLHTLGDEDAVRLFLYHARSCDADHPSRNDLEGLARAFVKECGGLPIAIVALASTLKNWPVAEWIVALTTLQDNKPIVDVDKELVNVYNCLKLSYDKLNNEKAQKLLLLCSIFPEDYEFPINLIIRIGIGSGIFGEVNEYCAARSKPLAVKNELIASSLLLKVENKECVKMHDLVREVAQWIAKDDIQVIMNSRTTFEVSKRFVFWSIDDFPDQFDGTKVEILLLWISENALKKDANAFFARMSNLKILFLLGQYDRRVPTPSLSQSLVSLKNIQTLILDGCEIGNISVLKNLQGLVTLGMENCLIIELSQDIMELKMLRLLGFKKCGIQQNNPLQGTAKYILRRKSQATSSEGIGIERLPNVPTINFQTLFCSKSWEIGRINS
ncbi:probable disease resistance protein At4g27220 [Neltuma alba]|uniref:probable disease resistance protein At4g27220 n=1 Tax=Neltuma alba TaxID=207710 RepID=UPI0010A2F9B1|nr:probable disease resistance protein At4g27220 [Prosopis alba]